MKADIHPNHEVLYLFPNPLYRTKYPFELTEEEKSFLDKSINSIYERIEKEKEKYKDDPNVKITNFVKQSEDTFILDNKELSNIKEFMLVHARQFATTCLGKAHYQDLKITQSWMNKTELGDRHPAHTHPNSFVSGVFYYKTTEKDTIRFNRGTDITNVLAPTNTPGGVPEFSATSQYVNVHDLDVLFFPSYLQHEVDTLIYDQKRITISCNTWLYGERGGKDVLTWCDNPFIK